MMKNSFRKMIYRDLLKKTVSIIYVVIYFYYLKYSMLL